MNKIIAINDDETLRIVKNSNTYSFERKFELHRFCTWSEVDHTVEEWLASKWILDYDLTVGTEYPTIDEIREMQKND